MYFTDERRGAGSRFAGGGENLGNDGGSPGGLAIVVILQGESWEWGSGNLIDGSALSSYGHVMVITLNYRLGALGNHILFTVSCENVMAR